MGRRRIEFDIAEVERLAGLGLTEEEIAYCLGVSTDTIGRRKQDSADFAASIKRGKARAGGEVANALMEQCRQGNTAAIIWYEKTRRGLSEHTEVVKRIEELERIARTGGHQKEIG